MVGIKRGTFVISESRTYVLFLAEPLKQSGKHYFRLELPIGYENGPYGVKKYYSNEVDKNGYILSCIPAEMYDETDRWLHRDENRMKNTSGIEWDCVKLVKRYRYREVRPKTLLFALPRIMVKALEEELNTQANLEFIAENPTYSQGPYYKDNHYCMVFRIQSSGMETVRTYWDLTIHKEITVFFTDKEAIFGTGVEPS